MEVLVHDCVETSLRNWYNIAFTGSKSPKVCFPSSFPIYQGRYKILTSYSFIRKEVNTALHWIKLCSLIFVDSSIITVNSLSQSPVFFQPLCQAYHDLALSYGSNTPSDLRTIINKYQETFTRVCAAVNYYHSMAWTILFLLKCTCTCTSNLKLWVM